MTTAPKARPPLAGAKRKAVTPFVLKRDADAAVKRAVAAERRRVLKVVRLSRIAWVSSEDMDTMLWAAKALLRHWDKRKGGRGER
jgi:hypothetical protein